MIDEEKMLLLVYDTVTMQSVPSIAASSLCHGWEGEVKGDVWDTRMSHGLQCGRLGHMNKLQMVAAPSGACCD